MNKISEIVSFLEENYYPYPKEHFTKKREPFRTLISCLLSQRTRDENTARAAAALFREAATPQSLLRLSQGRMESLIRPAGPYRQKARRIMEICRKLLDDFEGKVPRVREELMSLPGIGPKCADIVLMYGHGIPSIAVDTHVNRIPKRLGIVPEDASLEDVKYILEKRIPRDKWVVVNHGFVQFGRAICLPRYPKCQKCELNGICKYYKNVKNK